MWKSTILLLQTTNEKLFYAIQHMWFGNPILFWWWLYEHIAWFFMKTELIWSLIC